MAGESFLRAAREADFATLKAYVEDGRPLDYCARNGWTALHEASFAGQTKVVRWLLRQRGSNPVNIHARNKSGWTALHIASDMGRLEIVQALVDNGADMRTPTKRGQTALDLAIDKGATEVVRWFTDYNPVAQLIYSSKGGQQASASPSAHNYWGNHSSLNLLEEGSAQSTVSGDTVGELPSRSRSDASLSSRASTRRAKSFGRLQHQRQTSYGSVLSVASMESDSSGRLSSNNSFTLPSSSPAAEAGAVERRHHELHEWLSALGLTQYEAALKEDGFDSLDHVTTIVADDLDDMRMKKGHRRTFLRAVAKLAATRVLPTADGIWTLRKPGDSAGSTPSAAGIPPTSPTPRRGKKGKPPPTPPQPSRGVGAGSGSGAAAAAGELPKALSALGTHLISYKELKFQEKVGEGSFGVVRRALWRGMEVAVKELKLVEHQLENSDASSGITATQLELRHEAEMMRRVCNHQSIVQFVGVVLEPRPAVVTKFMRSGSLEDLLVRDGPRNRRGSLSWEQIITMALHTAAGVVHLHHENVVHRDLACRNILVDEYFAVRVADFGFSRVKNANISKGYTSSTMGPIKWMAPEALRFHQYSEASDVFSFGVCLYEIAMGCPPWKGLDNMDVVVRVCNGERMKLPDDVDPVCRDLMLSCWHGKPMRRPTMEQIHDTLLEYLERMRSVDERTPLPRQLSTASVISSGNDSSSNSLRQQAKKGEQPKGVVKRGRPGGMKQVKAPGLPAKRGGNVHVGAVHTSPVEAAAEVGRYSDIAMAAARGGAARRRGSDTSEGSAATSGDDAHSPVQLPRGLRVLTPPGALQASDARSSPTLNHSMQHLYMRALVSTPLAASKPTVVEVPEEKDVDSVLVRHHSEPGTQAEESRHGVARQRGDDRLVPELRRHPKSENNTGEARSPIRKVDSGTYEDFAGLM